MASRITLFSLLPAIALLAVLVCCSSCRQPAIAQEAAQTELKKEKPFPFYPQQRRNDCGASCLRMICAHYGKGYTEAYFRKRLRPDKEGTSLLALSDLADTLGFRPTGAAISLEQLRGIPLPCIVHWEGHHFIVVYKIDAQDIFIADPDDTLKVYDTATFKKGWYSSKFRDQGVVLILEKK